MLFLYWAIYMCNNIANLIFKAKSLNRSAIHLMAPTICKKQSKHDLGQTVCLNEATRSVLKCFGKKRLCVRTYISPRYSFLFA